MPLNMKSQILFFSLLAALSSASAEDMRDVECPQSFLAKATRTKNSIDIRPPQAMLSAFDRDIQGYKKYKKLGHWALDFSAKNPTVIWPMSNVQCVNWNGKIWAGIRLFEPHNASNSIVFGYNTENDQSAIALIDSIKRPPYSVEIYYQSGDKRDVEEFVSHF